MWTEEARRKARPAALKFHLSAEGREKMRLAHQTPEAREHHRQAALRMPPETREKLRRAATGKGHTPETREKLRQTALNRSPEQREKYRQARLRQDFHQKMTSIERLLRDEFKKRRLHFEMHKTMFRRFQPDFVFESARLIVQADGDYWHSGTLDRGRDAIFDATAIKADYGVWRFGEKQIRMHAPAIARAVARFVRDHQ